jgi:peptidoglycan/xylan/chitin deacetylase (PgdA/CDA1 family)
MSGAGGAGASAGGTGGMSGGGVAMGGAAGGGGQGGSGGQPAGAFAWPDGKTAAVTLTYDDGLDAQLAHAIPLLDSKGIKATFVIASFPGVDHDWALPNASSPLSARHQAWLAASGNGHEIAAHTVNHPCVTAVNPGQSGGFRLDTDYDMARIIGELDDSLVRIARLGATTPFTFGYPCYSDLLGVGPPSGTMVTVLGQQMPQGQVFTAEVNSRFLAARGSTEAIADPATVDLHSVPHIVAGPRKDGEAPPTLAQLTAVVDMAIAQHGWVVFLMHGVAGDTLNTSGCNGLTYAPQTCVINYLDTPTATHDGLINYLASKPEVWTTTLKAVAQEIKTKRGL